MFNTLGGSNLNDEELLRALGISPMSGTTQSYSSSMFSPLGGAPEQVESGRSIWDRIFAPLEAPQQTLFALTTGRGLWNSLSHGARYFNPFSDEERIEAEEVRNVLFGEMEEGFLKGVSNFALSLLYDPLLIAPAAKLLGASERAASVLGKAMNPAALVVDAGSKLATEVVGPLSRSAYAGVFGEEALRKVDRLGVDVMQAFINRFHGVDPDLKRVVEDYENFVSNLHGEGVRVLKTIDSLNPNARGLITEALESQDVWARTTARRAGEQLDSAVATRLAAFEERVLKTGVDPNLFWQAHERARNLDDSIGKYLLDQGLITTERYSEMQGTHLRRLYQAFENPQLFAERMDYLERLNIPDRLTENQFALRKAFTKFSDEIFETQGPLGIQPNLFDEMSGSVGRYFDDTGKFHAKNFTEDLLTELGRDSTRSIDEMFTYVRDTMLGGMQLPESFYATLGNYMTHGSVVVQGSAARAGILRRGMKNTPTYTFRTYAERLDAITDRKEMPDWYREALGEIMDAAPRIASEVTEVGGLVAARRFFDQISGTTRLTADDAAALLRAEELGFGTPEAANIFEEVATRLGKTVDELASTVSDLRAGDGIAPGAIVGSKGSKWAMAEPDPNGKLIYQVPRDESYGDLAGMYVDAATYGLVRGGDARDTIRSAEGKMLNTLGDMYRDGVGFFKMMKTVMDPTAQVRNFLGAGILADLGGYGFGTLRNAVKISKELEAWVTTGNLGTYMKIADDAGVNIWKQDLLSVELRDIARRYLDESVSEAAGTTLNRRPFTAMLEAANELTRRIPGVQQASRVVGQPGGGLVDFASNAFQMGDQWWKLGTFISRYDELQHAWVRQGKALTQEVQHNFARQAASLAQQSIFNYADVPWGINFVRKWGIVPFATFPFKAVPFVAKTLYENPWRVLKYDRAADNWNDYWAGSPEDAAREIDGLPPHMRERMVLRLPWNDGMDRPQYLDFSYYMPWEVIKDVQDSATWEGGFRDGFATPPVMVLIDAIRHNKDTLGREIIDATGGRSQAQNFEAMANFLASFMLPSWVPGGSRAASMGRTMMAVASNSPEPVKWMEYLGLVNRSPIGAISELFGGESSTRENTLASQGRIPQSHAQLARTGPGVLLSPVTSILGGASASYPGEGTAQERRFTVQERQAIRREIAEVRANRNLSVQERARRVERLKRRLLGTME